MLRLFKLFAAAELARFANIQMAPLMESSSLSAAAAVAVAAAESIPRGLASKCYTERKQGMSASERVRSIYLAEPANVNAAAALQPKITD